MKSFSKLKARLKFLLWLFFYYSKVYGKIIFINDFRFCTLYEQNLSKVVVLVKFGCPYLSVFRHVYDLIGEIAEFKAT